MLKLERQRAAVHQELLDSELSASDYPLPVLPDQLTHRRENKDIWQNEFSIRSPPRSLQ